MGRNYKYKYSVGQVVKNVYGPSMIGTIVEIASQPSAYPYHVKWVSGVSQWENQQELTESR